MRTDYPGVITDDEATLRRRLDTSASDDFPILTELREGGMRGQQCHRDQ